MALINKNSTSNTSVFNDNTSNLQAAGINLSSMFSFLSGGSLNAGSTSSNADNAKDTAFTPTNKNTADQSTGIGASIGLGIGGGSGSAGSASASRGNSDYGDSSSAGISTTSIIIIIAVGLGILFLIKRK